MSPQIFQHRFPNNKTLTLSIDHSRVPPTMVATPMGLAIKHPDEYERWVAEVVVPSIMETASEEVRNWFARQGANTIYGH